MLVDVIKHTETGRKYIIATGSDLPSNAYIRLAIGITEDEAKKYIPPKLNPKEK